MGAGAMRIATTRQIAANQEKLVREARSQAGAVNGWLRAQADGLDGFRRAFRESLGDLPPDLQTGLLRAAHRGVRSAATVALVDSDGVAVVPPAFVTGAGDRPEGSEARATAFLEHIVMREALTQDVWHSEPWIWPGARSPSIALSIRASETPVLLLVAEIELSVVTELGALSTGDHLVSVVTGDGRAMAVAEHALLDVDALAGLLGTDAQWAFRPASGGQVYGAVAPVPATSWTVVIAETDAEAQRAAGEIRSSMGAILTLVLAGALAMGALAAQTVSEPLGRLRDAALQVAEGRLGHRTDVARSDEIGELATAFNLMSSRLQQNNAEIEAQRAEIEAFNRELVARVDERTAQLREAQAELVRQGQLVAVAEVGAGLAHELNNPLMSVLGIVQIVKARASAKDALLLQDVETAALRCRDVVATMVQLEKKDSEPNGETGVDLAAVTREVVSTVAAAWQNRGCVIEMGEEPADVFVQLEPRQCGRVLAQVVNALKAVVDPGTRVRVAVIAATGFGTVTFIGDRAFGVQAERSDDRQAGAFAVWAARQAVVDAGGRLHDPAHGWRLELPVAR